MGGRVQGFRGALATEHYLSAQAGMDMLKGGGNAFDAAAAAVLVEGVVNPHMFTIGGECPALLYSANAGEVVSLNGNTEAPEKATLQAYRSRGYTLVPPRGVLSAGVPAAFSALGAMLERYGSLPLEAVIEPALVLARDGYPAHEGLLYMDGFSITEHRNRFLEEWPGSAEIYLSPDGSPPSAGDRMKNPPLAGVLDFLMETGRKAGRDGVKEGVRSAVEAFYEGDIAREIDTFVREREGFLTHGDLARFRTVVEPPVSVAFRDTRVFKCGPWSQGPVFLQMLRLLEGLDLEKLGHNGDEYIHLWVEAAKLAYADREQYYADPRLVDVPMKELLSEEYNELRRRLLDTTRASRRHRPGDPRRSKALLPEEEVFLWKEWGLGTVHVAAGDEEGNLAALTPSGGWIGGNEVVSALGFPLTSRLQTFYLDEAHPNVLAPRKRPRTTLSPSLAFRDGKPWMAFGTMGGDQQDQWTLQFFLNRAVFGMGLQEAVEAPKCTCKHFPGTFHPHDAFPARLALEGRMGESLRRALEARGHEVELEGDWVAGYVCAVSRREDGLLQSAADPRGRMALVFPSCALAW